MAFSNELSEESSSFHSMAKHVPVKISEHYRAPRKVTVSSGVLQRKHAEDFSLLYNFSLEKSIIDKMGQMKLLRKHDKQSAEQTLAAFHEAKDLKQEKCCNEKSEEEHPERQETHPQREKENPTENPGQLNEHLDRNADSLPEQVNLSDNSCEEISSVEVLPTAPPSFTPVTSPSSNMFTPISHLSRDSPVLSPIPFGPQSPTNKCYGAGQTPVSSAVAFTPNVDQVHYSVSNRTMHPLSVDIRSSADPMNHDAIQSSVSDTDRISSELYQIQGPSNTRNGHTPHTLYQNLPSCSLYPQRSNVPTPMLDSYTYPNTSKNYGIVPHTGANYSRPLETPYSSNFTTSTYSSVPMHSIPSMSSSSYSNATQSSHVSTISTLTSPVVHHGLNRGLIPGNSEQQYAPQYPSVMQPTGPHNMAVIKEKQKVNLKDFEQDTSSPFDNCELKSINDMEELRHVLEQCVIKQEQLQQQYRQSMQYAPQYQYAANTVHIPHSIYDHRSHPTISSNSQNFPPNPNSTQSSLNVQSARPPYIPCDSQNMPSNFQNTQNISSNFQSTQNIPSNFESTQNIPSNFQNTLNIPSNFPNTQNIPSNFQNTQNIPSNLHNTQNIPSNLHNTQNIPSNLHTTQNIPSNLHTTQNIPSNNESRLEETCFQSSNSNCFQEILNEEHISQNYLNNQRPGNVHVSCQPQSITMEVPLEHHQTPSASQAHHTGVAPLPPSSHSSEHSLHLHASSNVVRVPSVLNDLRNELRKKRESEELSEASIVATPAEISPDNSFCDTPSLPTLPIQVSYLPNPYLSLTKGEQETIDRIVEMGFLQSRTARAVQTLGPRQDKIIEFLIQVLALEEKFPELSATDVCEEALLYQSLDVTATEQFLRDVVKLSRLGFSMVRVARALRTAGNNQEKALDMLVS